MNFSTLLLLFVTLFVFMVLCIVLNDSISSPSSIIHYDELSEELDISAKVVPSFL